MAPPLNSLEPTRGLRTAAYSLGIIMLLVQLVELVFGVSPMLVHSPAWRLSFAGGAANIMMTSLLAMFLMIATAAFFGDRRVSLVLGGLCAAAVVFYLGMSGIFALDALQMRGQVRMSVARQYDFGSAWVLTRMLMAITGFIILSVTSLRAGRSVPKEVVRARPASNLVVGNQLPLPRIEEAPSAKRS